MSENLSIPMSTAITWTTAWRAKKNNAQWLQDHFVKGFLINKDCFENLIRHGAVEIRIYFGVDDAESDSDKKMKLVIVGVDANGNDMTDETQGDLAYNFARPCPPLCNEGSPLNTIN